MLAFLDCTIGFMIYRWLLGSLVCIQFIFDIFFVLLLLVIFVNNFKVNFYCFVDVNCLVSGGMLKIAYLSIPDETLPCIILII